MGVFDHKSIIYGGAFDWQSCPGGGEFDHKNFKSSNARAGGVFKLQFDQCIITNNFQNLLGLRCNLVQVLTSKLLFTDALPWNKN